MDATWKPSTPCLPHRFYTTSAPTLFVTIHRSPWPLNIYPPLTPTIHPGLKTVVR